MLASNSANRKQDFSTRLNIDFFPEQSRVCWVQKAIEIHGQNGLACRNDRGAFCRARPASAPRRSRRITWEFGANFAVASRVSAREWVSGLDGDLDSASFLVSLTLRQCEHDAFG